uniref:Uncharacterized protein n=1 Tax=Panagrolaimus superbus TaxID=310955 RepID=A0A914Z0B7_9BILA
MDAPSSFADAKPKMINGKIVWAGGPSIKQHFALPESIMYYIAKNPSTPEVYKKLIQSCKYFFEKLPLFVAANLNGNNRLCSNEYCDGEYDETCCFYIDFNKLSSKIWITNEIRLYSDDISTFSSLIFPKLFRWNIIELNVINTDIMFNDFRICASFLTDIFIWRSRIINDDGSVVMIDKILEVTSNIKKFYIKFIDNVSMINTAAMKNICKLKSLQNLKSFNLRYIPKIFNVDDLLTFIKAYSNTKIYFSFYGNISEEYKIQLDKLVDTVIKSDLLNCYICYPGENEEKLKIMNARYYRR